MKQNNKKIQPFSTIYILFKKKNFTSAWFKKKGGGGSECNGVKQRQTTFIILNQSWSVFLQAYVKIKFLSSKYLKFSLCDKKCNIYDLFKC